ncbi:LpxL/LpxP family Kdo(2)-lipid IV(A) lauroyl/palmitoleoyl acyltransferase [Neiella marina]|uniref:Lipid A biosynthesis acyltransferase n=1 Tax=Neiella holothuriorum TaxID=2870530 RepID=A0ABS7EBW0_9GAMM|nr:LpxL/LpxP family Kdo(2)-lipid IV(A) lauroyl/palmitoleoyl acyltransferase [Neiella holothuriorum]MBW8189704.1 LpxL/LpxP family Kdo(2)-lipid IV(A) lauroyl/palmitoleoyl acyltransferase [Neiella holothuriorum]
MTDKTPGDFQWFMLYPKYWPVWLGYGLLWLIVQLPFRWIINFGYGIGSLASLLLRRRRHIAATNIALCFPELTERQRRVMLKQNLREAGAALMETGIAWFWSDKRMRRITEIRGEHHFTQIQQQGQGVVMLACHMMSLEIGCRRFAMDHHAGGIYRPNKNAVMEYFQYRGRSQTGAEMLNRNNIRSAFKALKNGTAVWYAPDQDLGRKRCIFVPFFGVEDTATTPAAGPMVSLGKARLLPFFQYRKPDGSGYILEVQAPLEDFPSGDEVVDTTRINKLIEANVRRYPEQYLWVHRRFKTRQDPTSPSRYRKQ